jgi:hypothetical protein
LDRRSVHMGILRLCAMDFKRMGSRENIEKVL